MSNPHTALLLIDVINDLEFEGGEELLRHGLPAARNMQQLKQRAKQQQLPVIYINDNFGNWRDDFQATVRHCRGPEIRGRKLVEMLLPDEDDYFVLKPKHSAFYSTSLQALLQQLAVRRLVLCGFSSDICVLLSACDAYMRDYELIIPADGSAAIKAEDHRYAIEFMSRVLKAATPAAVEVDFSSPEPV